MVLFIKFRVVTTIPGVIHLYICYINPARQLIQSGISGKKSVVQKMLSIIRHEELERVFLKQELSLFSKF